MLICHAIFHCELFSWYKFLAKCEILNLADVGRRTRTAWMTTCLLSVEQLDTAGHVNFLKVKTFYSINIQSSMYCLETSSQTCCPIILADSKAFYWRSVFNGKTHNLQTWKYDVSMTSQVAKYIYFLLVEYLFFFLNIPWNFFGKMNIFHGDMKENASGRFLSEHSTVLCNLQS